MSLGHEDDMIDRLSTTLNNADAPQSKAEKELAQLQQSQQERMIQQNKHYLEELFVESRTQPIKIKNVQITNSQSFRTSFLASQFEPLLKHNTPIGLETFLKNIEQVSKSFIKLGLVQDLMVSVNHLPRSYFSRPSASLDVVPVFNIIPVKKFYAKTGTNIGNGEGDGYIEFQFKNLFGGAENLTFDAISGTKTQSSYLINYNQPLFNNANFILENVGYLNTRKYDWFNSDVTMRGLTNRIYTQLEGGLNHELTLENSWRILNNLNSKSNDILFQSGSSLKSSLSYNINYDTRNNHILPTAGKYIKAGVEFNGLTKSTSSPFLKSILESQFTLPVKSLKSSLVFTHKSGVLYPLGNSSFILDRFFIGGPNDVRSFTMNGLGPKSYNSSVGGDVFLNGGVSLVSKIPGISEESNFKLHNFVNFGKLMPLQKKLGLAGLAKDFSGNYSVSYGFGILFNHPMARFELNFVLPLAVHERDSIRKGIQYGIGVSFL
ncbi:uncharacterized protein CANTADRAFT_26228 [Suhomyces tanzawaensis NRRL Y-17324]|uniref:Bacterial surface antigen (D15) domain-containing protein n=1 Tax=Suhomyces tanzawaensis NRRL Y-17324 TaxID=984487 RepID=A0A1E4SI93_9ASCO|nr:uncharacterized protein CANTADRAFT_26228 [Suhomyces tanzawaensis NRRL Y-17324]ODV79234.1 hypothetical protein CANTADRAFT_26228 [Suhomyces tanzawaensis NRRL Y-17324]